MDCCACIESELAVWGRFNTLVPSACLYEMLTQCNS
jgi:hypothetical protein